MIRVGLHLEGVEPTPEPVDTAPGALRIYARDNDTSIRLIADGTPVADADRLVDVSFFDTIADAIAHEAASATILNSKPCLAADPGGWHRLPDGACISTFVSNLLAAARNRVWAVDHPSEDQNQPALQIGSPAPPASSPCRKPKRQGTPRTWSRQKDYALIEGIVSGLSAKEVAADPRIMTDTGAVYTRASRLGYSFREAPQIAFRLPLSSLVVIDQAAAAKHKTRSAFMREWTMKAAANPARYGLLAV